MSHSMERAARLQRPKSIMKLGEFLRNMRKQNGYSLREVVLKSKGMLDKTTVSRIEKDARMPSLRAVYALSKIYRVKMEAIAEMALGKKLEPTAMPFSMSASEKEMIMNFRRLSKKEKNLFAELLAMLAAHSKAVGLNIATSSANVMETLKGMSADEGCVGEELMA